MNKKEELIKGKEKNSQNSTSMVPDASSDFSPLGGFALRGGKDRQKD